MAQPPPPLPPAPKMPSHKLPWKSFGIATLLGMGNRALKKFTWESRPDLRELKPHEVRYEAPQKQESTGGPSQLASVAKRYAAPAAIIGIPAVGALAVLYHLLRRNKSEDSKAT